MRRLPIQDIRILSPPSELMLSITLGCGISKRWEEVNRQLFSQGGTYDKLGINRKGREKMEAIGSSLIVIIIILALIIMAPLAMIFAVRKISKKNR